MIEKIRNLLFGRQRPGKQVALVLSGGGARGLAHIGAIDELQRRGYHITSVAGTSMGALVGGLWAVGRLAEFRKFVLGLNRKRILSLIDISVGLNHVATADKLMRQLDAYIGGCLIEQLPVDFCCCATDVVSGREVVFREGSLSQAIRASIAIPCFFSPVVSDGCVLVDGSVHNTLPLDRVVRREGDVLVAVNVSAPDDEPDVVWREEGVPMDAVTEQAMRSWFPFVKTRLSENWLNMASRVARLSVQANTQLALRLTPPDVHARVPMSRFGLFSFERAAEIIAYGRDEMARALDDYEQYHLLSGK